MKCMSPIYLGLNPQKWDREGKCEPLLVPCGKCIACLSNKRRDWAFRLEKELRYSLSAYFITLTYDDDHLPRDGLLNKRDCQLFLKRLRKYVEPYKIRYFLVGEYGETFGRPHYHMLLFNFPPNLDIKRALTECWKLCDKRMWQMGDPLQEGGTIGTVTSASINYCAKYCVANIDDVEPRYRTFMLASRRPGIGSKFLNDKNVYYYRTNNGLSDLSYVNGMPKSLPRFFRNKLFTDEERYELANRKERYQKLCEQRMRKKYGPNWRLQERELEITRQQQYRKKIKNNYYGSNNSTPSIDTPIFEE